MRTAEGCRTLVGCVRALAVECGLVWLRRRVCRRECCTPALRFRSGTAFASSRTSGLPRFGIVGDALATSPPIPLVLASVIQGDAELCSAGISEYRRATTAKAAHWRLCCPHAVLRRIDLRKRALHGLEDTGLREHSIALRQRARQGEPLDCLLPEVFALVQEMSARLLDMRHYAAQLLGGIAMHRGFIAEMATGEGKTLTATLPVCLNALTGRGVHVTTANDYLARRDAGWMRPVYKGLGLTVGYLQSQMPTSERHEAYACDITYGTATEFGFDFLRDRLLTRRCHGWNGNWSGLMAPDTRKSPIQRRAHFALVDEADSVLIDQARTPLIVSDSASNTQEAQKACYGWCAQIVSRFVEGVHYSRHPDQKSVGLTVAGWQLARSLPKPREISRFSVRDLFAAIERGIKVQRDYVRDRDYIVRDGEVVIVDEFTGRLGEGRRWRDGIHQAIEAKEELSVSVETSQDAQITLQEFFSLYPVVAGMTGTAYDSRREFRRVYGLPVASIPTNRPNQRIRLPDTILGTAEAKWDAILDEVQRVKATGRPVLIGTRSIEKSEQLSRLLVQAGIEHEVLNAKQDAEEARISAQAGERGKVTVATNMAGRGTDVQLGQGVAELGGLHVICSELHESRRIDRQLAGRCGRQGDPGTVHQFLSFDDEILTAGLGFEKAERIRRRAQSTSALPVRFVGLFRTAQKKAEHKRFQTRRSLMRYAKRRSEQMRQMGMDPYLGYF